MSSSSGMSLLARVVMAGSRFANKHGVYMGRRATKVHVAVYRLSRGRLGNHLPGLPGARILLLDHIGAKTEVRRTSPIMYYEDGNLIAVAASQGGQPTNPAWFHNLRAKPDTSIQIGGEKRYVRARVASDEERDRLWPQFVAFCPDYDFWQRLAGDRKIPIVILDSRVANTSVSNPSRERQSTQESSLGDTAGR